MIKIRASNVPNSDLPMYELFKTQTAERILLHEYEIELLEFLLKFNPIRSVEFVDLATFLRSKAGLNGKQPRLNTSQRLLRLKQANLIKSVNATELNGYKLLYKNYFYTITPRALDVLVELNRIDYTTYKKHKSYLRKRSATFQAPSLHSIAVSKVAVDSYIQLSAMYKREQFEISKGSSNALFVQNKVSKDNLIPDLVISLPSNRLLCIEVDGGKQSKDVIVDKYLRYKSLAETKLNTYILQLIFASIDDDMLDGEGMGNKVTRSKRLKEFIPLFTKWPDNLNVFVFRYSGMPTYFSKVEKEIELPFSSVIDNLLQMWLFKFKIVLSDYSVNIYKESDLLPSSVHNEFSPNLVLGIKRQDKRERYYFVYYVQGGYVKSAQLLREVSEKAVAINNSDTNRLEIRVLLVYQTKKERESDVLEMYAHADDVLVLATSIEEWDEINVNNQNIAYPFYTQHYRLFNFNIRKEDLRL